VAMAKPAKDFYQSFQTSHSVASMGQRNFVGALARPTKKFKT